MPSRLLQPLICPPGQAALAPVLQALTATLKGTNGPALLLIPEGPEGQRIERAMRPELGVADNIALVIATSGSTGEPKGVLITAEALLSSAMATHERLGGPGQWLLALPDSRIAGLMVLVRSLLADTTPVVLDRFSVEGFAEMTDRLDPDGRRYTALVPTQLSRLLAADIDLKPYDAILLGGSSAAPSLVERARATGAKIVETYGMTETCGGCVYDGVPLTGVQVTLDQDGRIILKGPTVAQGYRNLPSASTEAFTEEGFVTSDLGQFDDDGKLKVIGRIDDMVITGGVNVAPARVVALLEEHPGVRECAVFGQPDAEWGQRVIAAVVPADPVAPPTLAELREYVAARAAVAFAPRELVIVPVLPVLPSGKLDLRRCADHGV